MTLPDFNLLNEEELPFSQACENNKSHILGVLKVVSTPFILQSNYHTFNGNRPIKSNISKVCALVYFITL